MLLFLLACGGSPDDTGGSNDTGLSCEETVTAMQAELAVIQACEVDEDCGQVLSGTSCGCTRDLVARTDADLSTFEALYAEVLARSCDGGFTSTCDCPEVDGYACEAGVCTWNYVEPPPSDWSACLAADGDALSIDGAAVTGDTLSVDVSYGGGCEDHDFSICWPDQSFMESSPVQVGLEIWHDGHDDACDAWISETLTWDLTPLKQSYQAAYGGGSGTMILQVGGFSVTYAFE